MPKRYQIGYKDEVTGKVRYITLSKEEGAEYRSLKSDEQRKQFILMHIQAVVGNA